MNVSNEVKELRLLFEISRLFDGLTDVQAKLDEALALMTRHTGMVRGSVALLEPDGQTITISSAVGLKPEEFSRGRYQIGEGITGRVIETGRPMVSPNLSDEPMFLNRTGARDLTKERISFFCVPIKVGSQTIGALSADRLFADSVALDEDLRLLTILASLIAQAAKVRQELKMECAGIMAENKRLKASLTAGLKAQSMIGESPQIKKVYELIAQVAPTNLSVMILGESGTGKELAAETIHLEGGRSSQPLIKVNCAALPEHLVESELFGHERGAFTGANQRHKGRFELAHGGTLFLDEVGELPPPVQVKLLRVLQAKEFERVGGGETIKTDVRLVAATNRNLASMVAEGSFREDLFHRLNVFPITLPPLRERREDITVLAHHFLDYWGSELGKRMLGFTHPALDALEAWSWPGNVRELMNVLARAVILSEDGLIHRRHLPGAESDASEAEAAPKTATLIEAVDALEKRMITEALSDHQGNMSKAAQALGISERIMGLRMKKFNFDFREFRKKGA
ncbi:sigma-54-dependent Fis family transcriptional regulator [Deltaproteobacteria bacterium Smac51]|nr:sigma-54-dependent Fis family transcriptional regulator [Deltaproteobacteria bacterium Smac51]